MLVGVRYSDVGAFAPFICDRYGMQADVFVGKRDPVIDVVRGIAIALVVLGHVTDLPSLAHKFIYSFHMPAFFIISGYLFNDREARENPRLAVMRKFFRLVVPAWALGLICGIPFVVFLLFQRRDITLDVFLDKLAGTLTGAPNVPHTFLCIPLWFLFCLFVVDSLAVVACGICRRYAPFIVLGIGVLGMAYGRGHVGHLPFAIPATLSACLFFAAGMLLRHFPKVTVASAPTLSGFSLLAWVVLMGLSPESVDMAANFFGADP